jgi:hypothetical protein
MNQLAPAKRRTITRLVTASVAAIGMLVAGALAAGPASAGGVSVYGNGPTDITATAGTHSIDLSWINPSSPKDEFTGMTIRRLTGAKATQSETGGSAVATTGNTTTAYDNTGLLENTEYTYSFFAHFKSGAIALTTFTAWTLGKSISDPHVDGVTPTSITLGWKNPTGSNFIGTWLVRADGTTPPTKPNDTYDNEVTIGKIGRTTTRYTDIGLNAGTKYSYALFAMDQDGQTSAAWIKTGSKAIHWSVASTAAVTDDVSCATTSFCAAVGGGFSADSWNGHTWTNPTQWDNPGGDFGELASVSCESATYCVATDDAGNSTTDRSGTWSSGRNVDAFPGNGFGAISCVPGHEYCVAVDSNGNEFTYHDGAWHAPKLIDSHSANTLYAISCASETFCVAADSVGNLITFDGTSWTRHTSAVPDAVAVSCSSTSFCMLVGSSGDSATYNGHTWTTAGTAVDNSGDKATGVSCVSSSFCMAVTHDGYESLYSGVPPEGGGGFGGGTWSDVGGWSSDTRIASGLNAQTVSCATTALCAVSGFGGPNGTGYVYFGRP